LTEDILCAYHPCYYRYHWCSLDLLI